MAIIDSGNLFHGVSGLFYVGTTGTAIPAIRLSDRTNLPTIFNSGRLNTDFRILPTGSQIGLFFDASTSRLGINTATPTAALHIKDVCADGGIKIESTDNCAEGVVLNLLHNPGTVAQSGDYPASINLIGTDTNDSEVIYAQIRSKILDPRSPINGTGYTSGELSFYVNKTGILSPIFVGSIQRTVLGLNNSVNDGLFETVIGADNYAQYGKNSTLIGNSNRADDFSQGILLGFDNTISGANIVAITNLSNISGINNLIFGLNNTATGNLNIVSAISGQANGSNNVIIGATIIARGHSGVFIGNNVFSSGNGTIGLGSNSAVGGNGNLYYGNSTTVSGNNILSIGSNQSVLSTNSGIFIGNGISSSGSNNTIIIGLNNSNDLLPQALLLGSSNSISGISAKVILLGQNNYLNGGSGHILIGQDNSISGSINNIVFGEINSLYGASDNNIVVGLLNNRTGVVVKTSGIVNSGLVNIGSILNHNIQVGIANNLDAGNNSVVMGHKNLASGNNNNIYGSFNKVNNLGNTVVGNSNAIIGKNNIVLGEKTRIFGNNSLNMGVSGLIYGDNVVSIGNNGFVSSGNVVGYNNIVDNVHNTVFGFNNIVGGSTKYKFTIDTSLNKLYVDRRTFDISEGDLLALYVANQELENSYVQYTSSNISYDNLTDITTFDITRQQTNLFHILDDFNNDSVPSIVSGTLVKIQAANSGLLGLSNIVVGRNNITRNSSGIILGNNVNISGDKLLVIGNSISYTGNNAIIIGSTSTNRMVLADDYININPAFAQSGARIYGNDGTAVQFIDFTTKRVGINKSNPNSTLDINGDISVSSIMITGGASEGYVLTSNASGLGSWIKQPTSTGIDNSLLVKLPDNTISGVDQFVFTPNNTGINLFDSKILFNATGTLLNNTYFALSNSIDDVIFSVSPNSEKTFSANLDSNNVVVTDSIRLPSGSLSGSLLYVENNGLLSAHRADTHSSITYVNNRKNPETSSKFRYFTTGNVLAISNNDNAENGFNPVNYDIILSSNSSYDISFNNQKNLDNHFTIWSNSSNNGVGASLGAHYSSSGVFSINTSSPMAYNDDVRLRVAGKVHANSIRVGANASTQSGYYLRAIDDSGNLALQPLSLPLTQLATYPVVTTLVEGANVYAVGFSSYKTYNSLVELQGGNQIDGGKTLVYNGSNINAQKWVVASNFRARQGGCAGACYRGIELGTRASILQTNEMLAFAGGAFKNLVGSEEYNSYNGSSQFGMYQLRTVTSGIASRDLITDYPVNTTASSTNTIAFNNTVIDNGHSITDPNRNYIWQYNISLNAIWQSGTDVTTIDGGCFVYEGAIKKIGSSFTQIGTPSVRAYLPSVRPQLSGIIRPFNNGSVNMLQILASGGTANYHIKWSATAQVNQINLPSGAFSFT
jgi:hypothetical protein